MLPHSASTGRRIRPLPEAFIHRTPRRTWLGPLDKTEGEAEACGNAAGGQDHVKGKPVASPLDVLRVLTRADFRARYRAQALGVLWSLLYPLVMMAIMSMVFTQVFRTTTRHFPIFLLIGLILWQWVSNSITAATQVFVAHADVIKRTVFRREMLPMAMVLSYGINFCIESLALVAFIPVFPGAFRLTPALLVVPVLLAVLAVLLTGIGMAMAVLNVIYRDVAYIVNTGLLLLYWLTPVIYPMEVIPFPYRTVLQCSPLAEILHYLRRAVMQGEVPTLLGWAGIVLPTALVYYVGLRIFRHYERMVLDYV